MELFFKNYKRLLIALILSLFFMISGEVCLKYNLIFTGFLFTIFSAGTFGYVLLFWFVYRKTIKPLSLPWTTNELRVTPILSGGLCISGILESHPNLPAFSAVFILILIYVLLFSAVLIRNHYLLKKGEPIISKPVIKKIVFWAFAIGIGRVLIIADTYGDNDALILISFIYFPIIFFLIFSWIFKQTKTVITLKNEKAKTELLHLKSQVNPHFFFNMLNNLYGLVDKDSKKAQELILKLSDMMRYSIYEGQKETVLLSKEISYLNNYIELHKMRYHKTIDIVFNHEIKDEDYKIMPLLFIILLENAFKHGVENLRENAFIYINMIDENNQVHFEVENNFDATIENEHGGIGLSNLERRLELVYPQQHSLSFSKTANTYKAQLNITKL